MQQHYLKTQPEYWRDVVSGKKTFELRRKDRNYEVGDELILCEINGVGRYFVQVTHILAGPIFGLAEGWVIMSIKPV